MAKEFSAAKVGQASSLSPTSEKNETGKVPALRPYALVDTIPLTVKEILDEQIARKLA